MLAWPPGRGPGSRAGTGSACGSRRAALYCCLMAPASPSHVAVIIPCFNEERHVARVVSSIPPLVRTIVVIDDASIDGTRGVVERLHDPRLVLVVHEKRQGVGAA